MCLGVTKTESEEIIGSNPILKLAPIFHFRSKEKKKIEIKPKRNKARIKNSKIREKIQKLPKIYTYFSVKQDFGGNEPIPTQLKLNQLPTKAPTSNRTVTEDKGGGDYLED